jgi:hypothetical protein
MGFLSNLFGGGAASSVDAVGNALDGLFTSDEERAHAEAVMEKLRQAPGALQVELNKVEAQHRSIFVAGWRPFIGWICGAGLGYAFLINPVIQWATGESGPAIPVDIMTELVVAMLGLGALRTVEKLSGRAK